MNEQGLFNQVWRKSSYSGGGGECIEVGGDLPGIIAVRDSKDMAGPRLFIAATGWKRFIDLLKEMD